MLKTTRLKPARNQPTRTDGVRAGIHRSHLSPIHLQHAVCDPGQASCEDILNLQMSYGNQAVEQLLSPGEQPGRLPAAASHRIQRARTGGDSLPPAFRRRMELHLGRDFSGVRLHTGGEADRLSQAVAAQAFTVGKDIFFSRGAYDPHSRQGQETLAHELTHVVQQSGHFGRAGALKLGKNDDALEHEAGRQARAAFSNNKERPVAAHAASTANTIQRVRTKREVMEDLAEMPGSVTSAFGSSLGNLGTSFGNPLAKTSEEMQSESYNVLSAKTGAPMSVLSTGMDLFSTGKGIYDFTKAHRERSEKETGGKKLGAEEAWKAEKGGAKSIAMGGLSGAGNLTGSIANIGQAVSSTAPGISGAVSAAPIMSMVTGGVDVLRKGYGMVRSAHKARQLGNIKGEIGERMANMPDDEHKEKLGRLQQVAKFGQKQKGLRAGLMGAGVVGGALGIAGGAALLASNPVGWGLAGAGALVGMGLGAYQLGKGIYRRSHRRDKLNEAETALGMADTDKAQTGKLDWLLGRDIKMRQEKLKEYAKNNPTKVSGLPPEQQELLTRAQSTKKSRMAKELTEQLVDTSGRNTPRAKFAQRIGQSLGVLSKDNQVTKSRGWNIFKKQQDVDLQSLKTDDDEKSSLKGLIERKFKVQ